jgi:hypothetical protein
MKLQPQRAPFFLGAAAALMLTFSTAAVYPQLTQAADATPTPTAPSQDKAPAAPDKFAPDNGKQQGRFGAGSNHAALLAEALGISEEDLQAAYLKAANAALDQAVAKDLLTQTQADNRKQRLEAASADGRGLPFAGRGVEFLRGSDIDGEALLADALGITADDLQAAYTKAEALTLSQAVENGQLTQDQADLLTARRAFQEYLRSQQKSYADQVQAALDAGAITQAQADLLLKNEQDFGGRGFGMGGDFGPGMRGGMQPPMGDHGMMPGPGMGAPGMEGGRGMQGGQQDGERGHGGRGMHGGQYGQNQGGSPDWGNQQQPDDSGAQSNSSFLLPNSNL